MRIDVDNGLATEYLSEPNEIRHSHWERDILMENSTLLPTARPQDPQLDGNGWTFETLEHGGSEPDTMPQAIRAVDANGRAHIYIATT